MQEEVENRSIQFAISTSKLTVKTLMEGYRLYRQHQQNKTFKHGKKTVKQLIHQGQGVVSIPISHTSIKGFEKVARKYGIDYAITKDKSTTPPNYLVFFKGRDQDALDAAFKEYSLKTISKENKPSVLDKLNKFKEMISLTSTKVIEKNKEHEL